MRTETPEPFPGPGVFVVFTSSVLTCHPFTSSELVNKFDLYILFDVLKYLVRMQDVCV